MNADADTGFTTSEPSRQLRDFASSCLKKDPALRLTASACLQHEFLLNSADADDGRDLLLDRLTDLIEAAAAEEEEVGCCGYELPPAPAAVGRPPSELGFPPLSSPTLGRRDDGGDMSMSRSEGWAGSPPRRARPEMRTKGASLEATATPRSTSSAQQDQQHRYMPTFGLQQTSARATFSPEKTDAEGSQTDASSSIAAVQQPCSKSEWQADSSAPACQSCGTLFGFLTCRRHHCRGCGLVFCDACSGFGAAFPLTPSEVAAEAAATAAGTAVAQADAMRLCNACYRQISSIDFSRHYDVYGPPTASPLVWLHDTAATRMSHFPQVIELSQVPLVPCSPASGCDRCTSSLSDHVAVRVA
eukprot:SAG31_NODE_5851_length_2296_cov_1.316340_1_plen_359_part_00